MGRTFISEENVENIIDSCIKERTISIGVLVGQQTQQKDYVIHAVKTPKEEGSSDTLDSFNDNWVANHAKQVQCMLPGGLCVLGIFAVGSPDDMKSAPVKLRQVLYAIHKTLSKLDIISSDSESTVTDRAVLQICSLTKRLTCRTFDVSDIKSAAKPADWKYQSFLENWIKLTTSISVDFNIPITSEMGTKTLKKQIQSGILTTCENIWNSVALLNKRLYNDNDPLDTSAQSGKKKKQTREDAPLLSFEMDLFTQMAKSESTQSPEIVECCAKMYVRGTMCCRAFVHNKAVAKEAIQALKFDAITTLYRRCELLCEDMLLDEEEQDPRILYETPRRVFANLPGTPLDICDYVFMEETKTEIQDRIKDLLGVDISEDDIDINCEKLPEDADLVKPDNSTLAQSTVPSSKATNSSNYFVMVVGSAFAAVVAGLSYMFIGDS